MKKVAVLVFLVFVFSSSAFAYISGIAIQNDKRSDMQMFVNGKLLNKHYGSFVRIKSQPGLFHLQLKVLNPYNKVWYIVKKDIRLEKGIEFYYKVVFNRQRRPELKEIRRYPVYSRYFLDPTLYNRHSVS